MQAEFLIGIACMPVLLNSLQMPLGAQTTARGAMFPFPDFQRNRIAKNFTFCLRCCIQMQSAGTQMEVGQSHGAAFQCEFCQAEC